MQNSLSFIGGFFQSNNHSKYKYSDFSDSGLPSFVNGEFSFYNKSVLHPLYCIKTIDIKDTLFLFIHGFFYAQIPRYHAEASIKEITDLKIYDLLKNYLNTLNGNFNGFFIDLVNKRLGLFTDAFGFEKIYYAVSDAGTTFSSSIWPLINSSSIGSLNQLAVGEHLMLGNSLNGKTIFNDIYTIPPGYIFIIDFTGRKILADEYLEFSTVNISSERKLISHFRDISDSHFKYVKNKIGADKIGMTLTGGNDTRVILNQMLQSSIKPGCISGYNEIPGKDTIRAKKITSHFKLPFHSINYTDDFESILKKTIILSNGYTNGIWMGNIARFAEKYFDIMYYGFSGDLVSGGYEFDPENISIEAFAIKALNYKTYYSFLTPEILLPITSVPVDQFISEYNETYLKYRDLPQTQVYFFQEKNERNHRRIASFADGSKLGPLPVYFFHDRDVLNFYRGLDNKWYKQQLLHHKLSFNRNPYLAFMPSANKTSLPSFMIPHLSKILKDESLDKIKKLLNKKRYYNFVTFDTKHDFFNFMNTKKDLVSDMSSLDFLDVDKFIKNLPDHKLALQDAKLLQMRFIDILGTINIIKDL